MLQRNTTGVSKYLNVASTNPDAKFPAVITKIELGLFAVNYSWG